MVRFLIAVAALAAATPAAHAASLGLPTPGYVYFHRAGADLAAHNAAVESCAVAASQQLAPVGFQMGGLLGGFLTQRTHEGLAFVNFTANLENCMVARG